MRHVSLTSAPEMAEKFAIRLNSHVLRIHIEQFCEYGMARFVNGYAPEYVCPFARAPFFASFFSLRRRPLERQHWRRQQRRWYEQTIPTRQCHHPTRFEYQPHCSV